MFPPPPSSPLFPYTTLFRSPAARREVAREGAVHEVTEGGGRGAREGTGDAGVERSESAGAHVDVEVQHLRRRDRKSTRLNSSHMSISYAVFCLKKKKNVEIN